MLSYRYPSKGLARVLLLLGALVYTMWGTSSAGAQERHYLFEVGAAGAYQSFWDSTNLGGGAGLLVRAGVWLPYNFSVEVEGSTATPHTDPGDIGVGVKTASGSLLYNLLLGQRSWVYAKAGIGGTRYGEGGDCADAGPTICGTTTTFTGGLGVRIGVTPTLMIRGEGVINPNKGTTQRPGPTPADDPIRESVNFTNFGLNLGVSLMLGSKPIPDNDSDGILNNRDRCADTPSGAQVDGFGCPADNDSDGVANGIDRCPNTAVGAIVDASGCTRDSDGDNIADGIDKCPDTPEGVLVDSSGCPRDSDGDSIADGLDRCTATPKGATVDALGCPGDEDADGVLDGLDRCPRTPIGATVNANGCVAGQQRRQPANVVPPDPTPAPSQVERPPVPTQPVGGPMVLEGVTFESGSARLQSRSYVELDSIAKVLLTNPALKVEIGGHTDDSGTPADNQHLSTLRAEAVRNYLVAKGVPFQQMVARGYGSTVPRTPDTTPRGRAANRRVEIRPLPPGL
jgi:outer membrane protein OmpA-like peptidoglycan-associated protein